MRYEAAIGVREVMCARPKYGHVAGPGCQTEMAAELVRTPVCPVRGIRLLIRRTLPRIVQP